MTDKGAITRAIEALRDAASCFRMLGRSFMKKDVLMASAYNCHADVLEKRAKELQSLKDAVPDPLPQEMLKTHEQWVEFFTKDMRRNRNCARLLTDAVKG